MPRHNLNRACVELMWSEWTEQVSAFKPRSQDDQASVPPASPQPDGTHANRRQSGRKNSPGNARSLLGPALTRGALFPANGDLVRRVSRTGRDPAQGVTSLADLAGASHRGDNDRIPATEDENRRSRVRGRRAREQGPDDIRQLSVHA